MNKQNEILFNRLVSFGLNRYLRHPSIIIMSAELAVVYAALILEDDNVEITVSINNKMDA